MNKSAEAMNEPVSLSWGSGGIDTVEFALPPLPPRIPNPTVQEIQMTVAEHARIPMSAMLHPNRKHIWAIPRQRAMYLAKEMTTLSYPVIGRLFGGRDHTTILYGHRKVRALVAKDADYAAEMAHLRERIVMVVSRRPPVTPLTLVITTST